MRFIMMGLAGLLLLSSCNLFMSPPAPQPTAVPPTEVQPTQVVPTATSTPVPSPNLFRDEFNQVLAGGWSWRNEDSANWSLDAEQGSLEITALRGHIVTGNYSNLLLRPAPAKDFQIETSLEFEPVANFQFAGLIVYESDSDFLQAGHAFCEGTDVCIGEGLYFDRYNDSTFQSPNFAMPFDGDALVYLRLQRTGDTYTFFASSDGFNWTEVGRHQSRLQPLQIGLVAAQNNDGLPLPARFGYFMLTEFE